MRRAALAASAVTLLLLAGCLGSGPRTGGDGASDRCQHWIVGLSKYRADLAFDANFTRSTVDNETLPESERDLRDEGRPLDRVLMTFFRDEGSAIVVRDARFEMRFFRADDGTPVRGYDLGKGEPGKSNQGSEVFTFGPGTHADFTIQVQLTPTHVPARPTPLRMELRFTPDLDGNPLTSSRVDFDAVGKYSYRAERPC